MRKAVREDPQGAVASREKELVMTSEQAIGQLSPAQRRVFERLQKSRDPEGVYLSRMERRSGRVLVRLGWAELRVHTNGEPPTFRLTDFGKLLAGPIVFKCS